VRTKGAALPRVPHLCSAARLAAGVVCAVIACISGSCARTGSIDMQRLARDIRWLESRARFTVNVCRRTASDGTAVWSPDGSDHYQNFWVRDFAYMVEGFPDGFDAGEVRRAFEYLIARQRPDGVMPDRVDIRTGEGIYTVYGPRPPMDNPQFMVKLAWEHFRMTGEPSLFVTYRDRLIRGMRTLRRSPNSALLYVPPRTPHSTYGSLDIVHLSGEVLFCSLLYYEAAQYLSQLHEKIGMYPEARQWSREARGIAQDLPRLWNDHIGLFNAASVDCKQPEIWGSAFAVYLGITTPEQTRRISEFLVTNYHGMSKRGQVRHLPAGAHWEKLFYPEPPGQYQNGAFWAAPVGWVAYALAKTSPPHALRLFHDMVEDFRRNDVYECINDDYANYRHYGESPTLPLAGIRRILAEHHIVLPHLPPANGVQVSPNPFHARTGYRYITFDNLPPDSTVIIRTLRGRIARRMDNRRGINQIVWDVDNEAGRRLKPGVYHYSVASPVKVRGSRGVILVLSNNPRPIPPPRQP